MCQGAIAECVRVCAGQGRAGVIEARLGEQRRRREREKEERLLHNPTLDRHHTSLSSVWRRFAFPCPTETILLPLFSRVTSHLLSAPQRFLRFDSEPNEGATHRRPHARTHKCLRFSRAGWCAGEGGRSLCTLGISGSTCRSCTAHSTLAPPFFCPLAHFPPITVVHLLLFPRPSLHPLPFSPFPAIPSPGLFASVLLAVLLRALHGCACVLAGLPCVCVCVPSVGAAALVICYSLLSPPLSPKYPCEVRWR